ncbi:MAG: RNA polymerase sigma factor [Deltaproteobacteria bacterium]|nr:RNA polymerase sigma factor [Deltaproteobacteria bacterium]
MRLVEPAEAPSASSGAESVAAEPRAEAPKPEQSMAGAISALPDEQLVALGLKGNVAAFETLYRRHVAFALHLAIRIAGSNRDAEDVVHDAFVKAFEKLSELSDAALFRAWLGSIVVHGVRSRMRRARLMKALGLGGYADPVEIDSIASHAASPLVRAQIAQVYALLQTLPTDERIAWTLRAVEGHELETVAQLTRCSLATVKRRISRAQQWLDEHFVETGADQELSS